MKTARWRLGTKSALMRRALTTALAAAMVQVAEPECWGYSDEPPGGAWLKLDENGEPCEVTLAGGTTLKLDTYGEEYEASESRQPVNAAEKGQTVFDYEKAGLGPGIGGHFLRLDVEGQRMYWIEIGPSNICNIRSAAFNGQRSKLLVELQYQSARGLALDPERDVLYWGSQDKPPSAARAIWKAGLGGADSDPLFGGLREPGAVAVEPASGRLFYFDGSRLVRGDADGRNEAIVLKSLVLPYSGTQRSYNAYNAVIDPKHGTIYWSANLSWIARANLDGTGFEIPFNGGAHIGAIALDPLDEKIYWVDVKSQEIGRANLDGSRPEAIAVGLMSGTSLDIDPKQRYVYWTDSRRVRNTTYGLIRRLKLPAPLATGSKPAPPLITAIEPPQARAGQRITLHGKHFASVTKVRVIGDDGRHADAKITAHDETELAFVVPQRREGVKLGAIVAEGPGGVTVTLPRETRVIQSGDRAAAAFDRFRDGDAFCFAVAPEALFVRAEGSLVYASAGAMASAGGRGETVLFLKNKSATVVPDAPGVVIYHEPFVQIQRRTKAQGGCKFIPVPAIRPSFIESLFKYEEDE